MTRFDTFASEADDTLLAKDCYTFSVLRRIIHAPHRLLLTDHERIILCYSNPPYPVWIWTEDECSDAVTDDIWQILKENELLGSGMGFNCKRGAAERLIKKAQTDSIGLNISLNMTAYECLSPRRPDAQADGSFYRCTMDDVRQLARMRSAFHRELHIDEQDEAAYLCASQKELVNNVPVFFWKNAAGKIVACCRYTEGEKAATVGLVYTVPEARRMHYAENLVYLATQDAISKGLTPMLYADTDYRASNACYRKLGYEPRGEICTVSVR